MSFSTRVVMVVVVFCVCAGTVLADIRPPDTEETQRIYTFTSIQNIGLVTENDALVWRQSNEILDANIAEVPHGPEYVGPGNGDYIFNAATEEFEYVGPGNGDWTIYYVTIQGYEPPLQNSEVQMVSSTRETTMADQGLTAYTKQCSVDTNWKAENQFNVEQQKTVSFTGYDTGRIASEESALVDASGRSMTTLGKSIGLCPFTNSELRNCFPPFCNIVETGSSLDMREVTFSTDLESRTIAALAVNTGSPAGQGATAQTALPVIDGPPTELNYGIRLDGAGQNGAATGSVAAHMSVRILDGSGGCPTLPGLGADIVYNERTTATGIIDLFQKDMHYESGIRCLSCGA